MRLRLDIRFKIAVLFISFALVVWEPQPQTALWLTLGLVLYLAFLGLASKALLPLLVQLILHAYALARPFVVFEKGYSLDFLVFFFSRIIPLSLAGVPLFSVPSSQILWFLQKIWVPKPMALAAVVAIRFSPMVAYELVAIIDAMKVRGLWSFRAFIRRPFATLEYTLVPLIFRSLKVADELSAAAVVRDIDNPQPRTYAFPPQWGSSDSWATVLTLAVIMGLWLGGGQRWFV